MLTENTLISCFTPFSFGWSIYFVWYLGWLDISASTFWLMATPSTGAYSCILDAIFTSSPNISSSFWRISPWWIPILSLRSSMARTASCIAKAQLTAWILLGKLKRSPSPISLSHWPPWPFTMGFRTFLCVSISANAFSSSCVRKLL